jgi:hypothetical protein
MQASKHITDGYSGTKIVMGGKALSRPARTQHQCLLETALFVSGEQNHLVLGQNLLLFIQNACVNKGLTKSVQTETILCLYVAEMELIILSYCIII